MLPFYPASLFSEPISLTAFVVLEKRDITPYHPKHAVLLRNETYCRGKIQKSSDINLWLEGKKNLPPLVRGVMRGRG